MKRAGWILLWSVVGAFFCFIIADCSFGQWHYFAATVTGHRFQPEYTEVNSYVDSDGELQTYTVFHPAEYHVICTEVPAVFDCNENSRLYDTVADGQSVKIQARVGKWTRGYYMPHVCD